MLNQHGFALLELSIGLILLAFFSFGSHQAWLSFQQTKQLKTNQQLLADNKQALLDFLQIYKFLPCPDTNGDGFENRKTNGACEQHQGRLPFLQLNSAPKDVFGNPFFYAINQNSTSVTAANHFQQACGSASIFAKQGSYLNKFQLCADSQQLFCTATQCQKACNQACSEQLIERQQPPYFHQITPPLGTSVAPGSLIVCSDRTANCSGSPAKSTLLAHLVPAIIISFGVQGAQTWQACSQAQILEQTNCNSSRFFQHFPPQPGYQHQMIWLTNFELKQQIRHLLNWDL